MNRYAQHTESRIRVMAWPEEGEWRLWIDTHLWHLFWAFGMGPRSSCMSPQGSEQASNVNVLTHGIIRFAIRWRLVI